MATWDDVINNPRFQSDTVENKIAARDSYFEEEIRPKVEASGGDVESIRADFNSEFNFGEPTVETEIDGMPVVEKPKEELTSVDRMLNTVGDTIYNFSTIGAFDNARSWLSGDELQEEEPYWFNEGTEWNNVKNSEEFMNQTPHEKRRIADAYYDKFVAPNVPEEKREEVRASFKQEEGIPTLDASGVAKEQKGGLARAKDVVVDAWNWLGNDVTDEQRINDLSNFATGLGEDAGNFKDWATGGTVTEDLLTGITQMATDFAEFGEHVVMRLPDAEFERQYGVPKSETGRAMNLLEQHRFIKEIQKRDADSIAAANRGEGDAPLIASTTDIREQAEEEAGKTTFDLLTDAATMIPMIGQAGRMAKATTGLQRAGVAGRNTVESVLAVGAGEVVKNADEGKDLTDGVAGAMIADSILGGVGEWASMPTKQAQQAAKTVAKGGQKLDDVLKTADEAAQLDRSVKDSLNGKAIDPDTLRGLDAINPAHRDRFMNASRVGGAAEKLDALYKKGDDFTSFKKRAEKSPTMKGIRLSDEVMNDWFTIRRGDLDDVVSLAKVNSQAKLMGKIKSPEVETYLRARELDDMGFIRGLGEDVSDTAGASGISKLTGGVQDLTNLGILGYMGDKFKAKASKKAGAKAAGEVQGAYDDLLSDIAVTSEGKMTTALRDNLQSKLRSVSDAEDKFLKEVESGSKVVDEAEFNKIIESFAEESAGLRSKLKEVSDTIKEEAARQPLRAEALKDLAPLLGKDKMSDAELLKTASALKQTQEGGLLFKERAMSNREGLDKAVTALAGRSKNKAANMSGAMAMGRAVMGAAVINFIGMPAMAVKAGIVVANGLAQKSQKRGLVQGVRATEAHISAMRKLEAKKKKVTSHTSPKDKAEINKHNAEIQNQIQSGNKAFEAKLDQMGSGVLSGVSEIMTKALRVANIMNDTEE